MSTKVKRKVMEEVPVKVMKKKKETRKVSRAQQKKRRPMSSERKPMFFVHASCYWFFSQCP